MRGLVISILSLFATQVVAQEDWGDVETGRPNRTTSTSTAFISNGDTLNSLTPTPSEAAIPVFIPNGRRGASYVRLSDFARSRSVEELEARLTALDQNSASLTQFNALRTRSDRQANRSVALASALQAPSPAPGATFRAGVEFGFAGEEQAIGVNFSTRRGKFDFSASGAFADGSSAARAGGGISW